MGRIHVDLPDSFPYRTEIHVRISDINYGGHLGNDAVLSIAHEARVRFLRHFGYSERDIEGVGIIMSDAGIVYRSESFYGDVIVVDVAVTDIQRRTCDIVYRMRQKETGREVALVKTGIAFFDYAKRTVVGVPAEFSARVRDTTRRE